MITHLRDRSYYEDLYDRQTVEECLYWEENFQKKVVKKIRELPDEEQAGLIPNVPHIIAGERYANRDEKIREWIDRDERRDSALQQAKQPYSFCPECDDEVECMHKSLSISFDNEPERVEFSLGCKKCKKVRHVCEDGTDASRTARRCEKCNHELDTDVENKKASTVYKEWCRGCGYKDSHESKKAKPPTKYEKEKFEQDKERFCLAPKEGEYYKQWSKNLNQIVGSMKDREEHKEVYESVEQRYKKYSVVALHKVLKLALKKQGYDKLRFADPDMGKFVSVDFRIQDTDEERQEYDSRHNLKKALEDALSETNWTLMSEGVSYRLGVLTGRLRGHENKGDLIALAKRRARV